MGSKVTKFCPRSSSKDTPSDSIVVTLYGKLLSEVRVLK